MTISGFKTMTKMWGGIVQLWRAWKPGISENRVISSFRCGRTFPQCSLWSFWKQNIFYGAFKESYDMRPILEHLYWFLAIFLKNPIMSSDQIDLAKWTSSEHQVIYIKLFWIWDLSQLSNSIRLEIALGWSWPLFIGQNDFQLFWESAMCVHRFFKANYGLVTNCT